MKKKLLPLMLALALALTGCAAHTLTKSPTSADIMATNLWLRLAESDQDAAQAIAKRLEPGKMGYFKADSGKSILLIRTAQHPDQVVMVMPHPELDGHFHLIQAEIERGDGQVWFVHAKILATTAEEREYCRVVFIQIGADLLAVPAGTPVFAD